MQEERRDWRPFFIERTDGIAYSLRDLLEEARSIPDAELRASEAVRHLHNYNLDVAEWKYDPGSWIENAVQRHLRYMDYNAFDRCVFYRTLLAALTAADARSFMDPVSAEAVRKRLAALPLAPFAREEAKPHEAALRGDLTARYERVDLLSPLLREYLPLMDGSEDVRGCRLADAGSEIARLRLIFAVGKLAEDGDLSGLDDDTVCAHDLIYAVAAGIDIGLALLEVSRGKRELGALGECLQRTSAILGALGAPYLVEAVLTASVIREDPFFTLAPFRIPLASFFLLTLAISCVTGSEVRGAEAAALIGEAARARVRERGELPTLCEETLRTFFLPL